MSTESVLIYYGVKLRVSAAQVKELERNEHAAQLTARQFGLDSDWQYDAPVMNEPQLLVGKKLGVMGCEYPWQQEINETKLTHIITETKAALSQAGFKDEPKLLMRFRPDW